MIVKYMRPRGAGHRRASVGVVPRGSAAGGDYQERVHCANWRFVGGAAVRLMVGETGLWS